MPRWRIVLDSNDFRNKFGLTEEELPDDASDQLIAMAWQSASPTCSGCGGEGHVAASGVPEGHRLVPNEDWERIQQERAAGANRERDTIIAEAVRRGKIAPAKAASFAQRYDADPTGTTELLNSYPDDLVPVSASGSGVGGDDFAPDQESYPAHWLPDVQAAQANADRSLVIAGD
jgi:hypothetical protein